MFQPEDFFRMQGDFGNCAFYYQKGGVEVYKELLRFRPTTSANQKVLKQGVGVYDSEGNQKMGNMGQGGDKVGTGTKNKNIGI